MKIIMILIICSALFLLGCALFYVAFVLHIFGTGEVYTPPPQSIPANSMCGDVQGNDLAAVKRDLTKGVNPNEIPDDDMREADLCIAAGNGNLAMMKLLFQYGADPNIRDELYSPLDAAAATNQVAAMKLLVSHGAKVNDDGHGGSFALMRAKEMGNRAATEYLLSQGAKSSTGV